jgi:hypothetical protein
MKKFVTFFILFCFCKNSIAQSVAINTTAASANASSILDVSSTTKGLLLPRMSKVQKNAIITPATGLLVYQTSPDSVGFQYFDGSNWIWLDAQNDKHWAPNGTNIFNKNTANVGIGTTLPKAKLHIAKTTTATTYFTPSKLILEDTTSNSNTNTVTNVIQLVSSATNNSAIVAGPPLAQAQSSITFSHINKSIGFGTNGINSISTDVIIDSFGRVGIGRTNTKAPLHVNNTSFSLPNAKYVSLPVAIFENGESFGNTAIQFMCKSTNDFSIFSSTDSTINRSNITFNNDSSISIGTGTSFQSVLIAKNGNLGIGIFTPNPVAKLDANGTFRLGQTGTVNSSLIKDTVNIDVPSIAADGEQTVTVALTGVTTNGAVSISPAADLPSGILIAWARVLSSGNVRIRFKNTSASAIDPVAINYFISVVQ